MRNFFLPIGLALILSLLIHLFFFDIFNKTLHDRDLKINTSDKIKKTKNKGYTSIKYVRLQKPKIIKKKILEPKPKPKPVEKKVVKQEVKKIVKPKKAIIKAPKIVRNVKKIDLPKPEKKVDLKNLFTTSQDQNATKAKQEKQLKIDKERYLVKQLDPLTQQYIKLYGEKYFSFSKEQKDYLKQNLSMIGKITQRYLQYPEISAKTGQSGVNVVEFTLHPNGDISDLRISDSSYFTALDKNTIETIQIAYKDYPRPKEPTKIKIFVNYILY